MTTIGPALRLTSLLFVVCAGLVSSQIPLKSAGAVISDSKLIKTDQFQIANTPQPVSTLEPLASQALILGVPFVSLDEAKQLDYANKDILNPSIAAAEAMIFRYWNQDLSALQSETQDQVNIESHQAKSFEEIKPWIDQKIPVLVSPVAITPVAHTLYSMVQIPVDLGLIPESLVHPLGPLSGMLGTMLPLNFFQEIRETEIDINFVRESVTGTARVVVGYDDAQQVVTLHDASFGPGWEISYEDFDRLWVAGGRSYLIILPDNYMEILANRSTLPAYPARTSDQRAAEAYVLGYALSAAGRQAEAETQFRQGLNIPGISQGMEHLLYLELAVQLLCCQRELEEGLAALQTAIDLLPENSASWFLLANSLEQAGLSKEAAEAKQKAEQLCVSQEAHSTVTTILPADLGLVDCQGNYF